MYKVKDRFIGSKVALTKVIGFGHWVVLSTNTPQKVLKALHDLGHDGIAKDAGKASKS